MKSINEIAFIVQARMNSERVPGKMLRPFAGTNLFGLLLDKLLASSIIPPQNIIASVYETELISEARKRNISVFNRSHESANNDNDLRKIYEWHDKIPYKYVVLISACNPLLKVDTIDQFVYKYIEKSPSGMFAVFEKKTYYWDMCGESITNWHGASIMNTKVVEPIYEAAHCMYASRLDIIKDGYWMDNENYPPRPELFVMDEIEAFDIDYEWQFKVAETLWESDLLK